jgi:hypothetical protein
VKLRIGGGQEFVIGGYTPSTKNGILKLGAIWNGGMREED